MTSLLRKTTTTIAGDLLETCQETGGKISADLQQFVRQPRHRLQLYKLLIRQPARPFAALIRALFQEEVQYRKGLWEGTVNDRTHAFEGIYDAAFLLYRIGDLADLRALWDAKWLNMDVGTSLGAEFFVGAGVERTLQHLKHAGDALSDMHAYVRDFFDHPNVADSQLRWEVHRAKMIDWRTDLDLERHEKLIASWPQSGRHILAQYDDDSIVVYQAYRPSIASFAVRHQRFGGDFSYTRMSWIKPNFLWMMYRSGWATKKGQEHVLAVRLRRTFFDSLLEQAVVSSFDASTFASKNAWQHAIDGSDVRLQWDPDHDPNGRPLERRALQLGLRGDSLRTYGESAIISIEDITAFVRQEHLDLNDPERSLVMPQERVYVPSVAGARNTGLDSADSR